jgi:hypothetical protein
MIILHLILILHALYRDKEVNSGTRHLFILKSKILAAKLEEKN